MLQIKLIRGFVTIMGQERQGKNVKRYYWLKLKEEFFLDKEVKKIRKIAGGDTYTIIYLKLMLLSLKTDGKLYFDGIEDTFAEELALEIDEDPENVRVTLMYLEKMKLLKLINEDELYLTQMDSLILSESESAKRVRKHREKIKNLEICDKQDEVGEIEEKGLNTELEGDLIDDETLQCNADVTTCNTDETNCNTYTDIYTDTNTKTKTKKKKEKIFISSFSFSDSAIVQSAFDDFLAMRIATKHPMTEKAILQLQKKLNGMTQDEYIQADILDQSTFKTWQDIYPLAKDFVSVRKKPTSDVKEDRYADYQ